MGETMSLDAGSTADRRNKVPAVTVYFWIVKLLTTAMGEATSDSMVHDLGPVPAVVIGGVAFALALALQRAVGGYIPWVYWLLVAMVAVFGTMAADMLHKLGMSHLDATILYAVLLAGVLSWWQMSERTLAMHSIRAGRRERFYWATVFMSFALGTAAGDMTADTMHLGNFGSGILFALLFALPLIGERRFGWNSVFAFWFAYIMTRPLGASFADWFAKPHAKDGLGFGTIPVGVMLTILIVVLVGYLSVTRRDAGARTEATQPLAN